MWSRTIFLYDGSFLKRSLNLDMDLIKVEAILDKQKPKFNLPSFQFKFDVTS